MKRAFIQGGRLYVTSRHTKSAVTVLSKRHLTLVPKVVHVKRVNAQTILTPCAFLISPTHKMYSARLDVQRRHALVSLFIAFSPLKLYQESVYQDEAVTTSDYDYEGHTTRQEDLG